MISIGQQNRHLSGNFQEKERGNLTRNKIFINVGVLYKKKIELNF